MFLILLLQYFIPAEVIIMRDFSRDTVLALLLMMMISLPTGYVAGGADEDISGAFDVESSIFDGTGAFIENRGQYDPEILFVTSTDSGNMALCRDGIRQQIVLREQVKPDKWFDRSKSIVKDSCIVAISFEGGSPDTIVGEDRVDTIYNFFLGKDPSGWATDVPGYRSVLYRDVWDGIDVLYYQRDGKLKYDVILSPGADPEDVRMAVDGAVSIQIEDGSLVISTPIGVELYDSGLVANYIDGGAIRTAFKLDGNTYGFDLPTYDDSRTVVIDPEYNAMALNFSTYMGGNGWDNACKMTTDSAGNIYIVGDTDSTNFPVSSTAYQSGLNGRSNDAFVFKMDKTGKSMISSTYIGGMDSDYGCDIKVDTKGNMYVVGYTYSTDFPTTTGAYDDTLAGEYSSDLFLLKLDSAASSLLGSTYLGGTDYESPMDNPPVLDLDDSNIMYVAADTYSRDFPLTSDCYQDSLIDPGNYWSDIVFVQFDISNMNLIYSTFLGGDGDDYPTALRHESSMVYMCGVTTSTDFNTTSGAFQTVSTWSDDGFALVFDMTGPMLEYCTYIGGSDMDSIWDLDLDSNGDIVMCGYSASSDFPLPASPFDGTLNGWADGVVISLDPTLSSLLFSTYLGFDGDELFGGIDVDDKDSIHLLGAEIDIGSGFLFETMTGVLQESSGGSTIECLYVMMKPQASAILYSTYLGGAGDDGPGDIFFDDLASEPVILGSTDSTDFPMKIGSYDTSHNGNQDATVTKFSLIRTPSAPMDPFATTGDSFIEISWSSPDDDGGSPVTGYSIFRAEVSGGFDTKLADLTGTIYNDTTVENGKTYYYVIRASNIVGLGMFSEEVEARPAAIPSAPRNLKVESLADKAVELTWTPPEYTGGVGIFIDGYNLYRTAEGETDPTPIAIDGPLTHYLDEDVENGVNYSYYITASNEIGESPPSGIVYAIPMKLPTEPLDLRVERGDGFVHLFWSPPEDEGGSPIMNYTITRVERSTKVMTIGPVTDHNDTDVVNGNVYKYTVKARNLAGYGLVSEDISARPLGHPSAPRAVTLTVGPSSITLSWEPPANDGGAPIDEYRIYRSETPTDLSKVHTLPGTEMTYTDTSVTNGRLFYYYMTAVNIEGESVPSPLLNGTPLDRPGAPIDLTILPGDGFVQISWNDPISDGGSPIMGFTLLRGEYESVMEPLAIVPRGQMTYNDTTVKNGKTYYYQVKAYNVVGNGTASLSVSGRPAGLPSPPDSITVTAGDRTVDIAWSKPIKDGGLPISGVTIYRWTATSAPEKILETDNSQGVFKDTSVQNGITYTYALTATNELGESGRSASYNATPIGKPSAVKNLIVKGSSSSSAELSWSAPDSDGGSPILHYYIYRSAGTGSWIKVAEVGPDKTTYTDKSLEAGKIYRYKVTAVNAQGEGLQTDEMTVQIEEGSSSMLGIIIIVALVILVLIVVGVIVAFLLLRKKKEPAPLAPIGLPIQTPDQLQMAPAPMNMGIMPPVQQTPLPPAGYYQQDQSYLSPAPLPPEQTPPTAIQQPVSYPPEGQPQAMSQEALAQPPFVQEPATSQSDPAVVPPERPVNDIPVQ
jgi:fibronectin type 3 domain-containing protein